MIKIALLMLAGANLELETSCEAAKNIYDRSYELATAHYPIENNIEDAASLYSGSFDGWVILKYVITKSYDDIDKSISKKDGGIAIKKTCMDNFTIKKEPQNFNLERPYIIL